MGKNYWNGGVEKSELSDIAVVNMNMQPIDVAWLAGLLEGEAYFGIQKRQKTPVLVLEMTDRDIVEKVAKVFRRRIGTRIRGMSEKPLYRTARSSSRAAAIMMMIYKFMGERRKEQIRHILKIWRYSKSYYFPVADP